MLVDLDAIPRREPGLEPFEVMICESQERMLAIVEPARWEAVRAVCERWELPVAIIGRVTRGARDRRADRTRRRGRARRRRSTRRRRPRAGPDPGRGPRLGRDRVPARVPAADAAAGRSGARCPARARRHASRARPGPRRGPPGAARLAQPLVAPQRVRAVRLQRPGEHRRPGRDVARPCSGSRARPRRSSRPPTANAPVGLLDPWLGAAMSVAEAARNVAITGARPLGVTNCLNFGDPTRPEAFWQLERGRPRPVRRLPRAGAAGHRRQRVAVQRGAGLGHRPHARDRRRGPARGRREARGTGVPRRRQRRAARGRARRGPRGERVRAPGGRRARGRPARARPRSRGRVSRRSSARRSTGASSRAARTSPAAGSPWRSPRWRCGAARGAQAAADRRRLAGGGACSARARRGSSSRSRPATFPRSSCSPASTGCRATSSGSRAARGCVIELAGEGATGAAEERGSRIADALDVPIDGPAPRLGARPATGARDGTEPATRCQRGGRLMCGVVGVVLPDRGHEAAAVAAHGPVRAPAPRPGVGRGGGRRTAGT